VNAAVELAQLGDTDQVSAIERAVFRDPWSANSFRGLPDDPRVYFACARHLPGALPPRDDEATERGGPCALTQVVGYVVAIFAADEGEIANLAVLPTAQGRGVGGLLLDAAIGEATHRGCGALYLEVRESNAPARHLYASRGFAEVGRRARYYQDPVEDALLLRWLAGPILK
jgi:[ribosomal protein S18]-alanine N-acetyltransferase